MVKDTDREAYARMAERVSIEVVAGQLLPANVLFLADACIHMDDYAQGLVAVDSGLELAEKLGQKWLVTDLLRLQAVHMMRGGLGDSHEIEGKLVSSMELAQQQNALSVELRAVVALSELSMLSNQTKQMRNLLISTYNKFREGLDTSDLKDAKNLLNQIS